MVVKKEENKAIPNYQFGIVELRNQLSYDLLPEVFPGSDFQLYFKTKKPQSLGLRLTHTKTHLLPYITLISIVFYVALQCLYYLDLFWQ